MFSKKVLSLLSLSVITISVVVVLHMCCLRSSYSGERKKKQRSRQEKEPRKKDDIKNSSHPEDNTEGEEVDASGGSLLSLKEAESLTQVLGSLNAEFLEKVLVTISNAAAFRQNQDLFRRTGCLEQLNLLLKKHSMTLQLGGGIAYPDVVNRIAIAINNLAVNGENQHHLKDCIPALIEFACSEHSIVQLASLQALTNLSVIDQNHTPYTKVIQHLYELLDRGPANVGLQALKILVNLSSNEEMVPHLLAAKAPGCLLDMLSADTDIGCLLRWTTVIANIVTITKQRVITAPTLPCEYKAASPETLYTALYGVDGQPKLNSKVFLLTKHQDTQVRHQANRLFGALTPP